MRSRPRTNRKKPFYLRKGGKKTNFRRPKFEGRTEGLRGYIYDCGEGRQADQFVKTTEELARYIGASFKDYPKDARHVVERMELPRLRMPPPPSEDADESERQIWKRKCDKFVDREEALEENVGNFFQSYGDNAPRR